MPTRKRPPEPVPTTTYQIEKEDETIVLTVPSAWKVTYGPVVPGSGYHHSRGLALRFYEAENKQRAFFDDVLSFRDTGIPIQRIPKAKPAAPSMVSVRPF